MMKWSLTTHSTTIRISDADKMFRFGIDSAQQQKDDEKKILWNKKDNAKKVYNHDSYNRICN